MKIASFDIGIKNLAVCIFDDNEIVYWNVLNTINPNLESNVCNKCGKSATVKTISESVISENESSSKEVWWCLIHDPLKKTRDKKEIAKAKKNKTGKKVKSCTTQELNIKTIQALDKVPELLDVDHVILELQPRFNPKMKQISQTVYSYFLIRGMVDQERIKKVCFVAAKNKLKIAKKKYNGPEIICNLKGKYAQRKYYSKEYTKWLLDDNQFALEIMDKFKTKMDDLADCYLQGIWYIETNGFS